MKGRDYKVKKIMTVTDVEGEGLTALLGEQVILFCMNYFYAGKPVGVNDTDVQIEDARVVYETGPFDAKAWQTAERLPGKVWYVRTASIESYGVGK